MSRFHLLLVLCLLLFKLVNVPPFTAFSTSSLVFTFHSKATIKRNSDTWDTEKFNNAIRRNTDIWARLVSTQPSYPNVDIVKNEVLFGRRDDVDVIVKDGAISSTHCRLWREAKTDDEDQPSVGNVYLEDLSTNGTFIKDVRVGKGNTVPITSGTEVCICLLARRLGVGFLP